MQKAVQMFTVRDFMNDVDQIAQTLGKIKAIGYEGVQTGTPPFLTPAAFSGMMRDTGLDTYSAGADFEAMETDEKAYARAVEEAHAFGVGFVAIGTLPEALRERAEGYRAFCDRINALARRMKAEGLKLLYHPHALECYSLGGGLKGLDILFAETDPDGLWFTLDTHWLQSGGVDVCEWIGKAKGRMELIHFKDYAIAGGAVLVEDVVRRFAEVGEGNLAWPAIIRACKENGVKAAAVEQDTCPGDPFDSLATSFANMVKMGV